jgi:hypothetical protein
MLQANVRDIFCQDQGCITGDPLYRRDWTSLRLRAMVVATMFSSKRSSASCFRKWMVFVDSAPAGVRARPQLTLPENIDPSILSRFTERLIIPLPDLDSRIRMLKRPV